MAKQELKKIIAQVAEQGAGPKQAIEVTTQILVFLLDQEEYAIPITDAREIIRIPEITPIPNAPAFIRGILNLRGKIVVVIDLEKRFALKREHQVVPQHIIVTEINGIDFGVIVDQVKAVLRVPQSQIQETPELVTSKIQSDYLQGVVVLEEKARKKPSEDHQADQFNKGTADLKKEREKSVDEAGAHLIILLNLVKLLQEKELMRLQGDLRKNSA